VYICRSVDDSIVYIGQSRSFGKRLKAHRRKPWWPTVAAVNVTLWCCFDDALRQETHLIYKHRPPHQYTPREIARLGHLLRGDRATGTRPKLFKIQQRMREAGDLGAGESLGDWLARNEPSRLRLRALCGQVQAISGVWTTPANVLRWYPELFPSPFRTQPSGAPTPSSVQVTQ
jgi:hypothetical protein